MSADLSDPAILQAFNDVKSQPANSWICLGYVPKNDTKLQVSGKGSDGLKEFVEEMSAGKILYGLLSFDIKNMKKFVYVAWCGEGVTGIKKGLFNNHANDVAKFFKGFHVQINARNEDDLAEKKLMEKLNKSSGASYDSGAKVQGETASVPTNVREGRQLATVSNASVKSADKSDYSKGNESQSFWTKQREEEEARKASARGPDKSDYNKKSESADYWAKVKQEEEQQKKQAATNNQRVTPSGNASSIKSQFENRGTAAPPPKPAPVRSVPTKQPEPEPVYEPEPEPEPTYEEPAPSNDNQYEENNYTEEPQQYSEDQNQDYNQEQDYQQQETTDEYQYSEDQQYSEQPADTNVVQCRALYDFDGENPDDLPFREGEYITILDRSDPSGWWQGELNGRVGFFPSNFVELA